MKKSSIDRFHETRRKNGIHPLFDGDTINLSPATIGTTDYISLSIIKAYSFNESATARLLLSEAKELKQTLDSLINRLSANELQRQNTEAQDEEA